MLAISFTCMSGMEREQKLQWGAGHLRREGVWVRGKEEEEEREEGGCTRGKELLEEGGWMRGNEEVLEGWEEAG